MFAGTFEPAPIGDVLQIFGLFLLIGIAHFASARGPFPRTFRLATIPLIVAAMIVSTRGLALTFAAVALLATALEKTPQRRLAPLLAGIGALLIAASDTLVLWDRMNTVFKLYLEAWLLFALAAAAWMHAPTTTSTARRFRVMLLAIPLTAAALTTLTGTYAMLRSHHVAGPRPTLDGQAYLERNRPDEAAAIRWLNSHVRGTPTLLEAQGAPYREYSRISMHTGLPTVVGWEYHLYQRAHEWKTIRQRQADVDRLYQSTQRKTVEELLRRYRIALVFVGSLEHHEFPVSGLRKFSEWTDLFSETFRSGDVRIFRVARRLSQSPANPEQVSCHPNRVAPQANRAATRVTPGHGELIKIHTGSLGTGNQLDIERETRGLHRSDHRRHGRPTHQLEATLRIAKGAQIECPHELSEHPARSPTTEGLRS
jgi:uncharacterized membrane protein